MMSKKNPKQAGAFSIPMLAVIISTLCAVALILAFSFLFRMNSQIVHGKNSNAAVSFNKDAQAEEKAAEKDKGAANENAPAAGEAQKQADASHTTLLRPAPADATEGQEFQAHSGNIQCNFKEGVSCTIYNYTFEAPERCKGVPLTFQLAESGASASCGKKIQVKGESPLATAKSMKHNGHVCLVNESGVDCWNEATGNGFTVARENASYTQK